MTRAQPWEFAAVGLQLEMFCTVLIFRPDDEMPGKHEKIVASMVFHGRMKNIVRSRGHRRVLILIEEGDDEKCLPITVRFYSVIFFDEEKELRH